MYLENNDFSSQTQHQNQYTTLSLKNIDWQILATDYTKKFVKNKVKEKSSNYQHQLLNTPRFPNNLKLRDYQTKAVISWLANKGRGTLKMATGSGKTIIALAIATELYQKIGLQVVIIICPYQHLV
ncbi:DEAD/DEAH box helicase, partial [Hyella patelloides]|uniref:DEAD/DEAH box helicase n=1 Tax=Hyella patelloides TaxID=1982969 RepID=UPI001643DE25